MATAVRVGLDERLVDVAQHLLEAEGLEAVTLRRIAREAGVSHGAPLRHYPTLAALLSRVATRGFRLLRDAIAGGAEAPNIGTGPRERLEAAGRAYVEAAVEHPGLFALMFRFDRLDVTDDDLLTEGTEAFETLVRLVRAAQDSGWYPERDTRVLAGAMWAAVHGLAQLWAQGAIQGVTQNDSLEAALALTLDVVAALQ